MVQPDKVVVPVNEAEIYNLMAASLVCDKHFKKMVNAYNRIASAMEKSHQQYLLERDTQELDRGLQTLESQIQYYRALNSEEQLDPDQEKQLYVLKENVPVNVAQSYQRANEIYKHYFPNSEPPFDYQRDKELARKEVLSLYYDGAGVGMKHEMPSHVATLHLGMRH